MRESKSKATEERSQAITERSTNKMGRQKEKKVFAEKKERKIKRESGTYILQYICSLSTVVSFYSLKEKW